MPLSRLPITALCAAFAAAAACAAPAPAAALDKPVYRCPGPPVLYTDALSPNEARERGCRVIEGAPVTIVPAPRGRGGSGAVAAPANGASRAETRVDAAEQRARDSDARRILGDELRREEDKLAALRREYNNGEPERRGDERNYQRYLDRVAELKVAIQRKESDVAALRRELAKMPAP